MYNQTVNQPASPAPVRIIASYRHIAQWAQNRLAFRPDAPKSPGSSEAIERLV